MLTTERADRAALRPEEALAELRRCAGSEFDPRVVEALAEDMEDDLPPSGGRGVREAAGPEITREPARPQS